MLDSHSSANTHTHSDRDKKSNILKQNTVRDHKNLKNYRESSGETQLVNCFKKFPMTGIKNFSDWDQNDIVF